MNSILNVIIGAFMSLLLMVLSHLVLGKYAILGLFALLAFCAVAWMKAD